MKAQFRKACEPTVTVLVRVAFDAGQTRALVTNILIRQPGVTPETLKTILDGSSRTAKENITRRTPLLDALIKELERVFAQTGEREKEKTQGEHQR